MAGAARHFTPAEAAAIGGLAVKTVHNAIDKRVIEGEPAANRAGRALSAQDMLFLKIWHEVGAFLPQERRRRLFAEIMRCPTADQVKVDSLIIVDVAEARRQIDKRSRDLRAAEAAITRSKPVMAGEAVFKGTRIPVRLIAAMIEQGADAAEILEGYPSLEARHLDWARLWTAAHPRRGRPKSLADRGLTQKSQTRVELQPAVVLGSRRSAT